jgi:hypothetical protein
MAKTSTQFSAEQIGATPETAQDLVQQSGIDGPALVAAWIAANNVSAVQSVAESGSGVARKAARRGLNVLRSRGVSIPDRTRSTASPSPVAEQARQAWLLPPDSAGILGIVLCRREPSGSYQTGFVYFRAGQHILRAQSGQLSLSKIKESMQQALGGAGYAAVSVPFAWAQHRVRERRQWHSESGTVEPLGLLGAETLLVDAPETAPPHPFNTEELLQGEADAATHAAESHTLHQMPEFRSWLPPEAPIRELLARVGRRLAPGGADNPDTVDPIVAEEVAAATDRYFTPERRSVLAARMKDSALSVLARAGVSAALRVAAVIRLIEDAGLITNPPSDVKFLRAFFDKALSVLAAQQGGKLRVPIPQAPGAGPTGGETVGDDAGAASREVPGGETADGKPAASAPEDASTSEAVGTGG